jgi:hypothetical protein
LNSKSFMLSIAVILQVSIPLEHTPGGGSATEEQPNGIKKECIKKALVNISKCFLKTDILKRI